MYRKADGCGGFRRAETYMAGRVAFLGLFGIGNFGNEASLAVALRSLRSRMPSAESFCICMDPIRIAEAHHIDTVDMGLGELGDRPGAWRWVVRLAARARLLRVIKVIEAYKHMRGVSVVVIPGTGILDDYGLKPGGVPLDLLMWCGVARARRAKVIFVGIGAGPIVHPRILRRMKAVARLATYRSFRDNPSKQFVESLGIDVRDDPVVPDIVFALEPGEPGPAPTAEPRRLVVGIGIMKYRGWNSAPAQGERLYRKHVEDMAEIVRLILERGHSVRIVIGENSDASAVQDVLERVYSADSAYEQHCVAPAIAGFVDLLRELHACDVVIAARFHNVLCSLLLGKPAISIGYAVKNRELLTELGLSELAHDLETLNVPSVIEQFDDLVPRRVELQESIVPAVKSYRAQVDAHLNRVWEMIRE